MTTRADVVAEARTWLGVPWVHQHRTRQGIDCAGLIICVARDLGLLPADFDITGYSRMADGTLLEVCDQHMDRIDRGAMQPGDVLVMATEHDPQHMGFIGDYRHGGLSLIHATNRAGRVVETRLMFASNQKFRCAYALRGVA